MLKYAVICNCFEYVVFFRAGHDPSMEIVLPAGKLLSRPIIVTFLIIRPSTHLKVQEYIVLRAWERMYHSPRRCFLQRAQLQTYVWNPPDSDKMTTTQRVKMDQGMTIYTSEGQPFGSLGDINSYLRAGNNNEELRYVRGTKCQHAINMTPLVEL